MKLNEICDQLDVLSSALSPFSYYTWYFRLVLTVNGQRFAGDNDCFSKLLLDEETLEWVDSFVKEITDNVDVSAKSVEALIHGSDKWEFGDWKQADGSSEAQQVCTAFYNVSDDEGDLIPFTITAEFWIANT